MLSLLILVAGIQLISCVDFEIHENDIGSINNDIIAAFCDYNADKHIDTLVISNSGTNVDVLISGDGTAPIQRINIIKLNVTESFISAIVPADFNGDGTIDILVHKVLDKNVELILYWGHTDSAELLDKFFLFEGSFKDEAIIFDYDSDMLPDILTENMNQELFVWKLVPSNFTFFPIKFTLSSKLSAIHSAAFVNIVDNSNTDLILQTNEKDFFVFSSGDYTEPFLTYSVPSTVAQKISLSSFADFNQDGYTDHVLAVNFENQNYIKVRYKDKWLTVLTLSEEIEFMFSFDLPLSAAAKYTIPFALHAGDFNQDGFIDILAIVKYKGQAQQPMLFENVECKEENCLAFGRKFAMRPNALPILPDAIYLATFFDMHENGNLDIIMTAGKKSSSGFLIPYTIVLINILTDDTCFIKVTVASGLCNEFCANGKRPHGVNNPGSTIFYQISNSKGEYQKSTATQMSQTAHFALQLPYVIFGLGQTPNFVDTVDISIPQPRNNKVNRIRQWTQIIPNSQLLVNPYTPDDPSIWKLYLFVMPSKQIYITAAVLGSTCLGLAMLTGGLLWLEKKEDREEKKQDSQKFHFDAM